MPIDEYQKQDWRSVMLAQYGSFGTIAGLEVASLSIFAAFSKHPLLFSQKILFTFASLALLIEVPLILWLINQERKVVFNEENMRSFQVNERKYRNFLILLMSSGWSLILLLLLSVIWFT